jgi:amidohydrolase
MFFFLGITPKEQVLTAAANHSPQFYVDEPALLVGLKALTNLVFDYAVLSKNTSSSIGTK